MAARTDVALGSMYGGMCLGPVNTAAVHALAYPLGSDFGAAHGTSNAVLLEHVLEFNLPAAPERYADIARAFGVPKAAVLPRCGGSVAWSPSATSTSAAAFQRISPSWACRSPPSTAWLTPRSLCSACCSKNPRVVTLQDARDIYRRAVLKTG